VSIQELQLAIITIPVNTASITNAMITDKRSDETVCGFVKGLVDEISTEELFEQFESAFTIWFDQMKGQLTTDAAGHLQTEIGVLDNLVTTEKTNLVGAINEVENEKLDKTGDSKDNVVTFTEAEALNAITSGSSNTTLWGLVKKFMSFFGVGTGNVAQAYSASNSYGVGAFVTYNYKMYRCHTKIVVPEIWNASKWTAISVLDMLSVTTYPEFESVNPTYFVNKGASFIEKTGKTVTVYLAITPSLAAVPNGATILTLPRGCRPTTGDARYFPVRSLNDGVTPSRLLQCNSSGAITYADNAGNATIGVYLDGFFTFTTNQ
jgi:hypothetical protein